MAREHRVKRHAARGGKCGKHTARHQSARHIAWLRQLTGPSATAPALASPCRSSARCTNGSICLVRRQGPGAWVSSGAVNVPAGKAAGWLGRLGQAQFMQRLPCRRPLPPTWLGAPGTASTLVGARAADGADQQAFHANARVVHLLRYGAGGRGLKVGQPNESDKSGHM